jgi:hypothetical protein
VDYSPDALVLFDDGGSLRKTEARNLLPAAYRSRFDDE